MPQAGPQKDQLCVKFGKGLCSRGDKCWFAHSLAEQRDAIKQKQEQGVTSKVSPGLEIYSYTNISRAKH